MDRQRCYYNFIYPPSERRENVDGARGFFRAARPADLTCFNIIPAPVLPERKAAVEPKIQAAAVQTTTVAPSVWQDHV